MGREKKKENIFRVPACRVSVRFGRKCVGYFGAVTWAGGLREAPGPSQPRVRAPRPRAPHHREPLPLRRSILATARRRDLGARRPPFPLQVSQAGKQARRHGRTPGSPGELGPGAGAPGSHAGSVPPRAGPAVRTGGGGLTWGSALTWEGNGDDFRQAGLGWALSTLSSRGVVSELYGGGGGSLGPGGSYPTLVPGVGGETGSAPVGKVHRRPALWLPLGNLRRGLLVRAGPSSSFPSGMAQPGHQKGEGKVQRQVILAHWVQKLGETSG